MRFTIYVKDRDAADSSAWSEPYNKPIEPPTQRGAEVWAAETVARFNASLRPGERAREVLRVEVQSFDNAEAPKAHTWTKTNLVTRSGPSGMYDELKCEACGATARRYGLGHPTLDRNAERKGYDIGNCKKPTRRRGAA